MKKSHNDGSGASLQPPQLPQLSQASPGFDSTIAPTLRGQENPELNNPEFDLDTLLSGVCPQMGSGYMVPGDSCIDPRALALSGG